MPFCAFKLQKTFYHAPSRTKSEFHFFSHYQGNFVFVEMCTNIYSLLNWRWDPVFRGSKGHSEFRLWKNHENPFHVKMDLGNLFLNEKWKYISGSHWHQRWTFHYLNERELSISICHSDRKINCSFSKVQENFFSCYLKVHEKSLFLLEWEWIHFLPFIGTPAFVFRLWHGPQTIFRCSKRTTIPVVFETRARIFIK